jgi:ATP-dependent helicase HrpB
MTESTVSEFNSTRGRSEEIWRLKYGELVLEETRTAATDSEAGAQALVDALLDPQANRLSVFEDAEALEHLVRRLAFAGVGPQGATAPRELLTPALAGFTSLSELKGVELEPLLLGSLPAEVRTALDRAAPGHVTLGRGRRIRIHYEPGKPPWVESRLQDFFGMSASPTVGSTAVTIHLLAPNKRAVQVTSDLAGFWKNHYATVRRELCRRYPRHSWPEDPIQGPFPPDIGERRRR